MLDPCCVRHVRLSEALPVQVVLRRLKPPSFTLREWSKRTSLATGSALAVAVLARRKASGNDAPVTVTVNPVDALASPFPLAFFEAAGLPSSSRFCWWESTRQGRSRPGLRSGLHPLNLDDGWLEESEMPSYAEAMAERRGILQEQRHLAVVDDGESRAAQEELLQLVLEHLARRFPERFELSADRFSSLQEGLEWQWKDVEPLDLLASLLQEDVCIMHERSTPQGGTEHLFVAGVVMESFDPVAKHMQPMMKLHEPVPGYAADLHESMGRVFSTLRKPVWRANFAMAEWRGGEEAEMEMRPEAIVSRLYLKVEYETLRRLPQNSEYLVFTIRPYMDPLPAWSRTPLACRSLAREIRRLPEGVLDYKGLGEPQVRSATLAFFDAVCAASGVDVEEAMQHAS